MVMVVALIVGLVVGLPAAESISGGDAAAALRLPPPDDESSAMSRAKELGQPVEIMSSRTSTTRIFAEPDGNQRMVVSALPTSALKGSAWVDIDPALERRPDGTVAPAVADIDLAFSGGGSGPLVRAAKGGVSIAYTWPAPLPVPTLSGAVATYPEVLPGVDLTLTAGPDGFSQVLVLRRPVQEDLADIRLGTQVTGGSLHIDKTGNLTVLDDTGQVAMHGNAPQMWDSSGSATEIGDRLVGPRTGDATAAVAARMEGSTLVLTPDRDFLSAPGLTYPVYIDPPMHGAGRAAFAFVSRHFSSTRYYGSKDVARVGYYNDPNVPSGPTQDTYRSFFRMNTAPVNGKHIIRATFRTYEVYSWSCSARPVELWHTGTIGTGTTWNAQPSWRTRVATVTVAKGYNSSCNDGGVDFNATSIVTTAAAGKWADLTLGLRASSESDTFGWKKFRNNPVLEITYNTKPNVPDQRSAMVGSAQGVPCATGTAAPYVTTPAPTLRARVNDADGSKGQTVRAHFEWHTGGAKVGERYTAYVASGTPVTAPIPAGAFADGARVSWRVRGQDGTATSGTSDWSPWCDLIVDTSRPSKSPSVTSADYPETPEGGDPVPAGGVGVMGTFIFRADPADTDVGAFLYALNDDEPGTATVVPVSAGGTAVIKATPSRNLLNTLYVWSRDKAGHLGPYRRYEFSVRSAKAPMIHWRLDETTGDAAADSSGNGHHATRVAAPVPADGPVWTRGWDKGGVRMAKGGRFHSQGTGLIRTDRNFSVAAWVRLTDKTNNRIVLSVDGAHRDGFHLMYNATFDRWAMVMASADTAEPVTYHMARSDGPPAMNNWTRLVGTFDAATGTIGLYVDGRPQAITSTHSAPWNATGVLNIGRGKNPDVPWWGEVDDVRVYDRVVYPAEAATLASRPVVAEGHWRFDEPSGTTALDSSGRGRHAEFNGAVMRYEGWLGGAVGTGLPNVSAPAGTAGVAAVPSGFVQTAGPILRTDRSYTVAAWARIVGTKHSSHRVLDHGAFKLVYDQGSDRWAVTMRTSDGGASAVTVRSDAPAEAGAWTHLAATYDYGTCELRLYVDGVLQNTATNRSAPYVGQQLIMGGQGGVDSIRMDLDDVRAYSGVLTEDEIADLAEQ
ncbi:LamG-like jellyroll fold domain-containing protein [Nonomuraea salmonea]|uniref:LamG-like jellyroll fold domain-containing protein n=1 Tax=Nonomuraea salmonea TaxID=46181 RepID=A0ABV5P0U4_9ACTN